MSNFIGQKVYYGCNLLWKVTSPKSWDVKINSMIFESMDYCSLVLRKKIILLQWFFTYYFSHICRISMDSYLSSHSQVHGLRTRKRVQPLESWPVNPPAYPIPHNYDQEKLDWISFCIKVFRLVEKYNMLFTPSNNPSQALWSLMGQPLVDLLAIFSPYHTIHCPRVMT
jgi:hypothetical protein